MPNKNYVKSDNFTQISLKLKLAIFSKTKNSRSMIKPKF